MRGIAAEDNLRRYIDLPKLFDLVANRSLMLPRLRQLIEEDPFECIARKRFDGISRAQLEERANRLEIDAPKDGLAPLRRRINPSGPLVPSLSGFDMDLQNMSDDELAKAVWYL